MSDNLIDLYLQIRNICLACGGVIGKECFNTEECLEIREILQSQNDKIQFYFDWERSILEESWYNLNEE